MDAQTLYSQYNFVLSSFAVVAGLYLCYFFVLSPSGSYEKENWVGRKREEWFSMYKARMRAMNGTHGYLDEGHLKFSKAEQVYILPEFAKGPIHIIPPSQIHNVLRQPESVLNTKIVHDNAIENIYTIRDPRLIHNHIEFDIVRRQLTRNLGSLTTDVAEELASGVEKLWGTDTENWKEVNLMGTIMKIVARAANRIFVGTELCRNETFIDSCENYSISVFGGSTKIKMLPEWLKPVLGPLLALPTRKYFAECFKFTRPLIEHRLRMNAKIREDPEFEWDVPNDLLQWLIEETYNRDLPEEREVELIGKRLCMVNMVAIHTTSLTSATTILDLYTSDPSQGFVEGLREECSKVIADEGAWSKVAVSKMLRMDSAVKESMRLSNIGLLGLERIVTAPTGVSLDHGIHIPKGARVAFSQQSIHHDQDNYPNPLSYDAFRFSQPREAYEVEAALKESPEEGSSNPEQKQEHLKKILSLKNQSMVTSADNFLAFGNGRHACPGRFFASNEVKLLLAYIVMNYEVEYMVDRDAKSLKFMTFTAPRQEATIRIRRRAGV